MVDFALLKARMKDPVYQEDKRKKQEAEDALVLASDMRIRAALDLCLDNYDGLLEKERSFVSSAKTRFYTMSFLSELQQKWLFDIAGRLTAIAGDGQTKI